MDLHAPLSPVYSSAMVQTLHCILDVEGSDSEVDSLVPS